MAQLRTIYSVAVTADVALANAAEVVIATLQGVDAFSVSSIMRLIAWAQISPGADNTSITLRLRRTALAGALVGEANPVTFAALAAQTRDATIMSEDSPGDVASQVYVLTATLAGGAAAGSALQAYILALVS